MSLTVQRSVVSPISSVTDNAVVPALQAFIKGLHHFNDRDMTIRHLKVLMSLKVAVEISGGAVSAKQIAMFASLKADEFEIELADLVSRNYVREIVPTFGTSLSYSIGPLGGTVIHTIVKGLPTAGRTG